jgi:protein TonB
MFCFLAVGLNAFGQESRDGRVRTRCVLLYSKLIKKVVPAYPPLAREIRIQGRVSMNCTIGVDGSVEKIEVTKGHPLLIQAATDAVAQWKFRPPILNGKGVETSAKIDMDFQLVEEKRD